MFGNDLWLIFGGIALFWLAVVVALGWLIVTNFKHHRQQQINKPISKSVLSASVIIPVISGLLMMIWIVWGTSSDSPVSGFWALSLAIVVFYEVGAKLYYRFGLRRGKEAMKSRIDRV